MRRLAILAVAAIPFLSACETPMPSASYPPPLPDGSAAPAVAGPVTASPPFDARTAARNFVSVVRNMEPVIERECRARTTAANCDFQIVVDDRPNMQANAYQTLSKTGQPIIAFTISLIAEAHNVDELAFIMGHEASHHILGHIPRQQREAMTGAIIFGGLASITGGDSAAVKTAQNVGASVLSRRFSKDYELEADQLGTVIAYDAGYNPLIGADFFNRLPDPGNQFLGSHPPNGDRIRVVQATMAALRGQ